MKTRISGSTIGMSWTECSERQSPYSNSSLNVLSKNVSVEQVGGMWASGEEEPFDSCATTDLPTETSPSPALEDSPLAWEILCTPYVG